MQAGKKKQLVKIRDVAAAAGVSTGTVSNVLNRPEGVATELVRRVQKAIDSLGYVPNSAARSLAMGTSKTVGFVLVDLANSLFADMARGAEEEAERAGLFLVLANADVRPEKQRAYLDFFQRERVAGTLLTLVGDDRSGLEEARGAGQHVVLLDVDPRKFDCCTVATDYERGGYLAARHLIDRGRTQLVYAGGPLRSFAIAERWRGACRAVEETAGYVTLRHYDSADVRVDDGRAIGRRLVEDPPAARPDGVVAAADLVAFGVLRELADAGLSVPDDLAMIACDDNKSAYGSSIPISTIDLPGYEMGRSAMQLLLDELRKGDDHVHRDIVIPPRLTARESSVGRHTD